MAMTKKELLILLDPLSDDAEVAVMMLNDPMTETEIHGLTVIDGTALLNIKHWCHD